MSARGATVSMVVKMSGSGSVTSAPAGISCTGGTTGCSADFTSGAQVVLTAAPASGWRFYGWSSPCSGTGTCTVTMNEAKTITAGFVKITPPGLTVTVSGTGAVASAPAGISCANTGHGSTTCSAAFTSDATVQLTATPAAGFQFYGWTGACTGQGVCSVTVTEAKTVVAYFGQFGISMMVTGSGVVTSSPTGMTCSNTSTSCFAAYSLGAQVTLVPAPAAGFRFFGWGGACSGAGACVVTITESKYVTASFVAIETPGITVRLSGTGAVTSSPSGINCSSTSTTNCSASFAVGTGVQLTATPGTGYRFYGWGGACTGTGSCTISVNEAKTVYAGFVQDLPTTVTVQTVGNGTVTSSPAGISCSSTNSTGCAATFTAGASVQLNAAPANGYRFHGWSGACTGTATTCTLSMTAARTVTATFIQDQPTTLTLHLTGNGTIVSAPAGISCSHTSTAGCSSTFASGTSVVLTATAAAGYRFYGWGGACSGTEPTCTVLINEARTASAGFIQNLPTTLTVQTSGHGTVTSAPAGISCTTTGAAGCEATFTPGTSVVLTATPATGYRFYAWSGACSGTTTATCTISVNEPKTVFGGFIQDRPTGLTVQISGNGAVTSAPTGINCSNTSTANCSFTFAANAQVVLTEAPAAGYRFAGWGGACGEREHDTTCTLVMNDARTVTAAFVQDAAPTITVHISGSGTVTSAPAGIACSNTSTTGCVGTFATNTAVVLTAAPAAGFRFYGWAGVCTGTQTSCTVSANEAKSVIAGFVQVLAPGLTVRISGNGTVASAPAGISCSGGTTDCSATFSAGVIVTLTATPATGWRFAGWGGSCAGTDPCVLTSTESKTVTAGFTQASGLSVRISGSGAVTSAPAGISCSSTSTVNCSAGFVAGTLVQLTATPATGFRLYAWGGACTGSTTCAVTTSAEAKTVTATFVDATRTSNEARAGAVPFGSFDTPTDGATNLAGAVPVTGWALDDISVERVEIWRNCVEAIDRSRGACSSPAPGATTSGVFVAVAAFLEGARPDVETQYLSTPQAYRAGWGYLLLTNALPHQTRGTPQGGQGSFTLSAYAVDVEGNYTLLGQKTIDVSNDTATLPFGTIDSPPQGATIPEAAAPFNNADAYPNFGWAATQAGKCIDTTSTGTYHVYIDGVSQTLLAGLNWFPGLGRADIAAAYPGLCNSTNAVAVFYLNATQLGLAAGLHTIAWDVVDSDGKVNGIGSRFFNVASSANTAPTLPPFAVPSTTASRTSTSMRIASAERTVRVRTGPNEQAFAAVDQDAQGRRVVQVSAVDRLTIDLDGAVDGGYEVVGDELRPLPAGSTLHAAAGRFYWQPPVAFIGSYTLAFMAVGTRIDVRVTLAER